jgi:hypothetical protein
MYQDVMRLAAEITESAQAPHLQEMESYWYPGQYWPEAASNTAKLLIDNAQQYHRHPGRKTRATMKATRRHALRVCGRFGLWVD